jgi:hypothetical protein
MEYEIQPVYILKFKGHTVDMQKSLKDAEDSFKYGSSGTEMYFVEVDGSAKLIRRK